MIFIIALAGCCQDSKSNINITVEKTDSETIKNVDGYLKISEKSQVQYEPSSQDNCYHVKFDSKCFIGSVVQFEMPGGVKAQGIVSAIKIDASGLIKYFVLAEDNESLIEFDESALTLVHPIK
jgi:hypothetical protein